MKDKEYNFDEIVQKAFQQRQSSQSDVSECLSNETIKKLYAGKLSGAKRQEALEHLDKCDKCSADLAVYAELAQNEKQLAARTRLAEKLKSIKAVLPKLSVMLDKWDFRCLTQVIGSAVEQIKLKTAPEVIDEKLQFLLETIQLRLPQLAVQTRGRQKQQTAAAEDIETLSDQLSKKLKDINFDYNEILTGQHSANAEMKLFNGLDESLKLQAAIIRDACQNYYERNHLRRLKPFYINYGSIHAREMLARYVKLSNINKGFSDEFIDFIIYCSIYCYDLGMSDLEGDFGQVLNNRGLKTKELLLSDNKSFGSGLWQKLGFKNQKIANLTADLCCFDNLKNKLPESRFVFFNGRTRNFPTLAGAALIKILDLLTAGSYRLTQFEDITEQGLCENFLREYLIQQLIYQVNIEPEYIEIESVIQYEYPFDDSKLRDYIEETLVNKINELKKTIGYAGLKLPAVKLEIKQTIFRPPHPLYGQFEKLSI
jgi:hypothetical protein